MNQSLKPILIEGGIFKDDRGQLEFVNNFSLANIKRMYFSSNANTKIIRAWQGHKVESRWFYCLQGIVDVRLVAIDNWDNPSKKLKAQKFILKSNVPQVLFIPKGYVNGFKSIEADSKLMIFSDFLLNEVPNDEFRFDKNLWTDWNMKLNY